MSDQRVDKISNALRQEATGVTRMGDELSSTGITCPSIVSIIPSPVTEKIILFDLLSNGLTHIPSVGAGLLVGFSASGSGDIIHVTTAISPAPNSGIIATSLYVCGGSCVSPLLKAVMPIPLACGTNLQIITSVAGGIITILEFFAATKVASPNSSLRLSSVIAFIRPSRHISLVMETVSGSLGVSLNDPPITVTVIVIVSSVEAKATESNESEKSTKIKTARMYLFIFMTSLVRKTRCGRCRRDG